MEGFLACLLLILNVQETCLLPVCCRLLVYARSTQPLPKLPTHSFQQVLKTPEILHPVPQHYADLIPLHPSGVQCAVFLLKKIPYPA